LICGFCRQKVFPVPVSPRIRTLESERAIVSVYGE